MPSKYVLAVLSEPLIMSRGADNRRNYHDGHSSGFCCGCDDILRLLLLGVWDVWIWRDRAWRRTVRHAIAAVAALLKSLKTTSRSPLLIGAQQQQNGEYRFAVQQYTKAISSLRHLLSTSGSHYTTALVASVLFITMETLHGDLVTASIQIVGAFCLAAEAVGCHKVPRKARTSRFTLANDKASYPHFTPALILFKACPHCYLRSPVTYPENSSCFENTEAAKASFDTILKSY
jgi:hypothetical protein